MLTTETRSGDEPVGEASLRTTPNGDEPRPKKTRGHMSVDTHIWHAARPEALSPATYSDGQMGSDTQMMPAIRTPVADEGHSIADNQRGSALVGDIIETYRRAVDMMRAQQRLDLQAQAICRRLCAGDKAKAGKLWAAVKKGTCDDPAALALTSIFLVAIEPIAAERAAAEKSVEKMARKLPVHGWAKEVKGLGDLLLGKIVGECAAPVGDYRSPACVWKRMGLAVIGGGRQRRVTGDDALEHGYNAQRRSLMWNVGDCLIRAQVRAVKDEAGERTGSSIAIGEYGQLYLERKAYEAPRVETAAHAHNRAKRYIEKRLLRDLWRAWRQATDRPTTSSGAPAADTFTQEAA